MTAVQLVGQLGSQRRFTARRRPGDDEDGRLAAAAGSLGVGPRRPMSARSSRLIAGPRNRRISPGSPRRSPAVSEAAAEPDLACAERGLRSRFRGDRRSADRANGARRGSAAWRSIFSSSRRQIGASGCWSPIWNRRSSRTKCWTSWRISSVFVPQVSRDHPPSDERRDRFRRRAVGSASALLQGMEEQVLDEAAARIRLMPGARQLVATMRAARRPNARLFRAASRSSPNRSRPSSVSITWSPTGSTSPPAELRARCNRRS